VLSFSSVAVLFAALCLFYHFFTVDPSTRRPELGKIYRYENHGQIVYVDFKENWLFYGLLISGALLFLASAVVQEKWPK
jgi:hypothetical protein